MKQFSVDTPAGLKTRQFHFQTGLTLKSRNGIVRKSHDFSSFWTISSRTWPRDLLKRVGPEKWCRTHPKSAPETNSKPVSWVFAKFPRMCFYFADTGSASPKMMNNRASGAGREGSRGRLLCERGQTLAAPRCGEGLGPLSFKKPHKSRPWDPSRPAPEAQLLVHFRGNTIGGHGVPEVNLAGAVWGRLSAATQHN